MEDPIYYNVKDFEVKEWVPLPEYSDFNVGVYEVDDKSTLLMDLWGLTVDLAIPTRDMWKYLSDMSLVLEIRDPLIRVDNVNVSLWGDSENTFSSALSFENMCALLTIIEPDKVGTCQCIGLGARHEMPNLHEKRTALEKFQSISKKVMSAPYITSKYLSSENIN